MNAPNSGWSEADVVRLGFDLSTVRRSFKRQFGITFLEMARQRRLRNGFGALVDGGKVIEAQLDAQFESASAFSGGVCQNTGSRAGGVWGGNPC